MLGWQLYDPWWGRFNRRLHGSSVKLENISQCPSCSGTDRADEVYEGYGFALYKCERCCLEWWS